MTTCLPAHGPGIDRQVPLEEMQTLDHGHHGGAQVQPPGQRHATGQVKVLDPGAWHARDQSGANLPRMVVRLHRCQTRTAR